MAELFDQYATAKPLMRGIPSWVGGIDQQRLGAYNVYEQIYWNVPEAFKLMQRGSEENAIYVPSGRQIVETLHRYMANNLKIVADPTFGTDGERFTADEAITNLLRRERFYSRFAAAKRYGIIHGDWLFHLYADPAKPEGSRISIFSVDPGTYFPIFNPKNIDEIIGCHLVEQVIENKKPAIYRMTYRKKTGLPGPSPITVEEAIFEPDAWGGPGQDPDKVKQVRALRPPTDLPPPIDALPIYHIANFKEEGTIWGSSEMRGLERLLGAVNQAISDEDLALALDGLGLYATDAGEPQDENGEPRPWALGPGRVVEIPTGTTFNRVSGLASVTPYQEHIKYLHDQIDYGVGQPAVAKGRVDVAMAESGIALTIELAPLLSRVEEKEQIITDVLTQMLFDLKKWFIAYEGIDTKQAIWIPTYGEKIPINRKQRFEEILAMLNVTVPLVSAQWARSELRKIGYEFPDDTTMMSQILDEKTVVGTVEQDLFGARVDEELSGEFPPETGAEEPEPVGAARGT